MPFRQPPLPKSALAAVIDPTSANVPGRAVHRMIQVGNAQLALENAHSGTRGTPNNNMYQLRRICAGLRLSAADNTMLRLSTCSE